MNRKLLSSAMAALFIISLSPAAMAANQDAPRGQTTDQRRPSSTVGGQGERAWQGETMDQGQLAEARQDAEKAVTGAADVIRAMTNPSDQERSIPKSVLEQAQGIVIIPGVVKGALIAGGRFGRGVLMTRNQGQWSLPAIVTIGGGSLGAQIGVESTDMVMVFKNQQSMQNLLQGSDFTLGADASVAAGSSGAKAKGMVTEADVITYKGTRGLFAGVALTGGVLDIDDEAMYAFYRLNDPSVRAYYGEEENQLARKVLNADQKGQNQQIVQSAPQSAKNLQQAMNQMGSGSKK